MLATPKRLLDLDFVTVFIQSQHFVLLKKKLDQSLEKRESYLSMHAVSMPIFGEQHIYTAEGQSIIVKTGEMVVLRRGLYSITDLVSKQKGFSSYLLFFDDVLLEEILRIYGVQNNLETINFFSLQTPQYFLEDYWRSIESLCQQFSRQTIPIFHAKVLEFFGVLMAAMPDFLNNLTMLKNQEQRSLRAFMEAHFDKALEITDYAYLTGRSESTFRREFKLKFGLSPKKWIIQRRMELAIACIEKGITEVAELSLRVGYENVSHFIAAFKKQYNCTPGQYLFQSQKHNKVISDGKLSF